MLAQFRSLARVELTKTTDCETQHTIDTRSNLGNTWELDTNLIPMAFTPLSKW